MANILDVISAITPMGGTIAKLRVLMTKTTCHNHVLYHPGFKSNKKIIEEEIQWYKERNIPAYYGINGRNIFKNALAVTRIIRKHHIDIVHYYFNHEQSFAGLVKLMNPTVKMVRSVVGYDSRLPLLRHLMLQVSFSFVPNYIFISKYIKRLYESEYPVLKKKHTCIIYNGAVNVKNEVTPIASRKKIVVVGGLCERKNSDVLIESMNIIVNVYHRNDIILYIIGDGPDRAKTEAKLKLYNIVDNVILVGYTDKVPDYLDDCAVYVHPAITEGFGIAVTEAMQMHCPCIVADKGALPELIADGECGFVIDAFAPEEWANKILYLFDNVEERVRMGENAYLHAKEHFSLEAFVQHHDELYKSL